MHFGDRNLRFTVTFLPCPPTLSRVWGRGALLTGKKNSISLCLQVDGLRLDPFCVVLSLAPFLRACFPG